MMILKVVWHKQEETLTNLHCGREYHIYVVVYNTLGASPASQVTVLGIKYVHLD
jgi:hypothetical protein